MTNLDVDPNADFNAENKSEPTVLRDIEIDSVSLNKDGSFGVGGTVGRVEKSQSVDQDKSAHEVKSVTTRNTPLQAKKGGLLVGGTLEEQYRLAQAYCRSGLMPKGLNTPEKVLVGLQLCYELNLPPMSSIGRIMVVNGTPAIFGDLPIALAHRSGKMESYSEVFEDKDGQPYGCTCTVKRKGQDPITRSFTVDDAKKAGLFRNDIWNKYTKRMLQCRARAWALKDALADVLMGVSIMEYDFNATVENGEVVGAQASVADDLNARFLEKKE